MTEQPREKQIAEAVAVCSMLKGQGWGKVSFEVTRGGTIKVAVEAAEGANVAPVGWSTGRKAR